MKNAVYGLLIIGLLSTACQKSHKRAPVAPNPCGGDLSLNKTVPVRTDTFRLTREYATFRRTTCDGRTITSRETVKDPKGAYSLAAQNLPPGEYLVSAYNRTTCDQATIKPRQATETRMEIQVHTSPGTRRTHVLKDADNYIDYEFRRCLSFDASRKCLNSEIAERGTLILKVEYSELDHPGIREVTESCNKTNP